MAASFDGFRRQVDATGVADGIDSFQQQAFGVLTSPRYPGGIALRFARVKRYRPDKNPDEADTIDALRALLR